MLITGGTTVDEWFAIDEIATELESSRQPVMDALRRLSIEGFVEIVPQVGCRVHKPNVREIQDFFKLFSEGEALIAELASERADANDILSMQLISAQIGVLAEQPDKLEGKDDMYRVLNRRLHADMRQAAKSPAIAEIVEGLGDRSDFYIAFSRGQVFAPNLKQAHAEHEEIIAAIAGHDAAKARTAMKKHIIATEQRLESHFPSE